MTLHDILLAAWFWIKGGYCFLVGHRPGQYRGVLITDVDRDQHKIEYANKFCCPRCRRVLRLDFW